MKSKMLYFSSLLKTTSTYQPAADNLFATLDVFNIKYKFIFYTKRYMGKGFYADTKA